MIPKIIASTLQITGMQKEMMPITNPAVANPFPCGGATYAPACANPTGVAYPGICPGPT
jgi:hypothetical protein